MKKIYTVNLIKWLFLNLLSLNALFSTAQQNQFSFLEITSENAQWYGNNHFEIQNKGEVTQIDINKMPWEAFTLDLNNIDLTDYPLLRFQVKSDTDISLRVDVCDSSLENKIKQPMTEVIPSTNDFIYAQYDLRTLLKDLDATEIAQLKIFVDPGKKFKGTILIKNLHFFSTSSLQSSSKKDVLVLTNTKRNEVVIQSLQKEFDEIKIYNESGQLVNSSKMESTLTKTFSIENQGVFFVELFEKGRSFHIGQFVNQH